MGPKNDSDEQTVLAWKQVAQRWEQAADSLREEQRRHIIRMQQNVIPKEPEEDG